MAKFRVVRALGALLACLLCMQPVLAFAKTPNDIQYDEQWYLTKVDAPDAWDVTTGSHAVVVAVLDTGVDLTHPDLADNIWTNTGEVPDNGVDDDDNGFVDDVYGWDFVQDDNDPTPNTSGSDVAVSHGTLIAGMIGAQGNNSIGVAGVAWNVQIMSVRMLNASGAGDSTTAAHAIDYAVANGADVINLSFAGDNSDSALRRAVQGAYAAGVVVVAAMGNETRDTNDVAVYPACLRDGDHDWVIGVASSDMADTPSSFSNYGAACTDLTAPGEDVYGLQYYDRSAGFRDAYGGMWSGTSMASPLVAGAAALVRSAFPSLSVDEIRNVIKLSVDPLLGLRAAQRHQYGAGRLNIANALAVAAQYAPATDDTTVPDTADNAGTDTAPATDGASVDPVRVTPPRVAFGGTSGTAPVVDVRKGDGTEIAQFAAYADTFAGGITVALGDVNGDGTNEVVTGVGDGGGPQVRVFTETGALVSQFFAYDNASRHGVAVATGDVDGDGTDEIITAVGNGVSQDIVAWSMKDVEVLRFTTDVFETEEAIRVAAGDVDGDGTDEIILANGKGSAPLVALYSSEGEYRLQFAPYGSAFTGGVFVAAGDVDGDGTDEIVTGTGDGGGPQVRIFTAIGAVVGSFFAFDETSRHGVHVAAADLDGDGKAEIIAAPGPGMTDVRVLSARGAVTAAWASTVTGGEGTVVAAW